jgi:hypothetical protein
VDVPSYVLKVPVQALAMVSNATSRHHT